MAERMLIVDGGAEIYASALAEACPELDVIQAPSLRDVPEDISDVTALLAFGIAVDNGLLERATGLKWIQALATGVDHFLRMPALRDDTVLTSMRGIHGPMMREMVLFLMLSAGHNISRLTDWQAKHHWQRYKRDLLFEKTAFVCGTGISGAAIGQALKALDMKVIGVTRTVREIDGFDGCVETGRLAEAVAGADYLINVLPADVENENLFGKAVFDAMRPDAWFINVGRGETVDQQALLAAVQSGGIGGAAMDVFRGGPLGKDSPFWDLPNVIVTPHVSGYCTEYEELAMSTILDNAALFVRGRADAMKNIVPHGPAS